MSDRAGTEDLAASAHFEATRQRNEAHIEAGRLLAATGITERQRKAVAAWLRYLDEHELVASGCAGCVGEVANVLDPADPNE